MRSSSALAVQLPAILAMTSSMFRLIIARGTGEAR
jgi:hypothetical protein